MDVLEGQMVFLNSNLKGIEGFLKEIKNILEDPSLPIKSESVYIMLTILKECCKNEQQLEMYFIPDEAKAKKVQKAKELIKNFIAEEKENILNYIEMLEIKKRKTYLRIKNMEWKFIGLAKPDDFLNGKIQPKILVKLTFNNDTTKIFESDYATLKKLQEEFEDTLSAFNGTYNRRVENFAK